MVRYFALSLLLGFAFGVHAQLDSTSAVLLRPSGAEVSPEDLDSSRYKIRSLEGKKEEEDLDEKPGTLIPSPVPPKLKKATVKAATTTPPAPAPTVPAAASAAPETPAERAAVPVSEQVRELILGEPENIEEARRQIHPEDPRANVVTISLAPAYFYEGSESQYAFRRFSSNGPGFGLGMNLWLTPFFGLQSRYFSSVTASVGNGAADRVPLEVQNFTAGLRFRKHFGFTRKAAQLSWGIDYFDGHDKISRESTSNVGHKSSGLGIGLEGVVPQTVTYAHTFGIEVRPYMHHSEQGSGVNVRSGTKAESNGLSLALGGDWTLDRRNQVFWKAQYSVERNLFRGTADTVDPQSGLNPSGVSVTESLLIFYFGFRWGS